MVFGLQHNPSEGISMCHLVPALYSSAVTRQQLYRDQTSSLLKILPLSPAMVLDFTLKSKMFWLDFGCFRVSFRVCLYPH